MNKRDLGISIYPLHQSIKDMKDYILLAKKYKFTRIFTSLLELEQNKKNEILEKFSTILHFAKDNGFHTTIDINPKIIEFLNIDIKNLKPIYDLGAQALRLDEQLNGKDEADMTFNEYGIDIEINISNGSSYLENILNFCPSKERLLASHNFYPQKLTGLEFEYFKNNTKRANKLGIATSAFITSSFAKTGPWPINDGICTLEMHRNLPIESQAKHLWALGFIDCIFIGNANASEDELKKLSELDKDIIELKVKLEKNVTKIEQEIIYNFPHFRRGDINKDFIRSTFSRNTYKNQKILEMNNKSDQKRGDIFIGNDLFKNYKGELHLIINVLSNDKRKNLVAKVDKNELFLLDYIISWKKFKFIK